jgi:hypothetical protein
MNGSRTTTSVQPEPERKRSAGVIYLCPDCVGTLTARGLTWQCRQPHPEREAAQAQAESAQDIKQHIQFLLQQGKTTSEILVLIWQQQPTASGRFAALQHLITETAVSGND